MPPPEAVKSGKVQHLSDEDRLTLVRWIDLGCPIDLGVNPAKPEPAKYGWHQDDQRPTLTLTTPKPGANVPLERILVGMHDYGTGLDPASFTVTADFALEGAKPGDNLAERFKPLGGGVYELELRVPLKVDRGKLTVSVKDKQGNVTRIERTFSAK
jgi:hypothetical protein